MKTLQRFSSSLGNQIKELGVKVSSKDVWGKGSLDDTTEKEGREFFSSRILGSVHAGEILFETDSLFHDLILQIEDATIHLLLQHFNLEDLPQASSAFASRAAQFGEFDLMDSVYCTSQIGVIRSCIRRMVCHNRTRLREQLDAIFLNISSSYDKNISINGIPGVQLLLNQLSGEASADKPISYSILSDESFTSTIHLKISSNCSDDTKSSKHQRPSRERIPTVSVVVAGSGSEQVHGVYTQVQEKNLDGSSASSFTLSYSSCEGYLITRKMKRILLRSNAEEILTGDISLNRKDRACELKSLELVVATEGENQSVEAQENKACLSDLTVYQWILSNPSLASCYYTCCTLDSTSLPPALGWRPSGSLCQGKMPGPQLTMSDNEDNDSDYSDSDNTAIDTHVPTETNSDKSPVAKKKEMMRKSERRKMNGKNRKCATDTVGAPMLTLDFFSTESLGVTSCRSACRSVTSNGKLLKRIVVPSIARIYVSPFSRKISNCQMMCSAGLIVEDETVSSSSCNKKSLIFNYCPLTTDWNGMISKDLDDICEKKLLKLVHDCSAEEASLVFNIERTKERVAWLSKVTDIDELLLGPGLDTAAPMDDPSNDSGIEYFASQWGLEEILKKKSQTDSVMLAPGCATSLVEIASTHSKDQFAVGIGDQTCLLDGVKAVSVRKATSMPIIGSSVRTEERTESPCHRRSQSQSQSVYQWPVDFNSYSRDDESEEDHLCAVDLKSMRNQNEGRQTFDSNMESSKTHKLCNSSDTENLPKPKISKSKSLNDALKSNGLERSSPRTGVEEVILSLELDLTDRKLLKTIGRKSTQYLSELQDLATPLDRQCYSYANVDVIGVELRGSSLECGSNMSTSSPSVHTVEKAHYVIRVSLRECTEPKVTHSPAGLQKVCNLRTSTATVDACNTDRNAMFRESIGESRDISSVPAEYRNHSVMSYSSDLPPILAVEENINNGFSQSQQPRSTAGILKMSQTLFNILSLVLTSKCFLFMQVSSHNIHIQDGYSP